MSMGKLKKADVEHVAKLAKLNLTPDEVEKFKAQLSDILGYINKLNEVNTDDVEPTSQTTGLVNVTRKDKLRKEVGLTQKQTLSGTKKSHNGYFVVPMVLEEKTV
jgi:aspartyl-tRNA(Asn)/glutamyl-tRNA(Gln) amidotransferase subunit C